MPKNTESLAKYLDNLTAKWAAADRRSLAQRMRDKREEEREAYCDGQASLRYEEAAYGRD